MGGTKKIATRGSARAIPRRRIRGRRKGPAAGKAAASSRPSWELSAVLDALNDAAFLFDAAGELLAVNRAALLLLGQESWRPGSPMDGLFSRVDLKYATGRKVPLASLASRLALAGKPNRFVFNLTGPSGHLSVIEARSVPLVRAGEIAGAAAIWTDITEREELLSEVSRDRLELDARVKQRTQTLTQVNKELWQETAERRKLERMSREATEILARLFDSISIHIAHLDNKFCYVRVNRAYARAVGRVPAALLGRDHFDLFPDADLRKIFLGVVETGKPFFAYGQNFFRVGHLGRPPIFWDWSVQPVTDLGGRVSGIVLILIDVTQRLRAEFERLLLAMSIDQAQEPVVIMDSQGTIQYANRAFSSLYGLPDKDVAGRNYSDLAGPDLNRKEFQRIVRQNLLRGEPWTGRVRRKLKSGRNAVLDVILTPLRDERSRVTNISAVERDITREMAYEEQLRQNRRLESLGTLAGGIAHDFNNLLMPIMINAEMALNLPDLDEPLRGHLETVLLAAQRAKGLIGQILTFSRQAEEVQRTRIVQPMVQETINFVKGMLPANVELRTRLDAPEATSEISATQLHQVLMNLCTNALSAMKAKGGVLEIALDEIQDAPPGMGTPPKNAIPGRVLNLSVSDTGEGMNPQILEKVFDPFFTTRAQGEGSGMGLAVVHGIVKAYKGAIDVSSEPGQGSTFRVYLPLIKPSPQSAPAEWLDLPRGTERILLVDDEPLVLRSAQQILEQLGYRLAPLIDGTEALRVFAEDPASFDLVITDQVMPGMNGTMLAQEILRIRPNIPIILCTGFTDAVDEAQAKALGIRVFLRKPFLLREIAEVIRQAIKAGIPHPPGEPAGS